MRYQIMVWFFVGGFSMMAFGTKANSKTPCVRLAERICSEMGLLSFICDVHREAARKPDISQKMCRQTMKKWYVWLKHMRGLEERVTIYEKQGKGFGRVGEEKVKVFKESMSKQIVDYLCGKEEAQKEDAFSCERLVILVCKDLGRRAFFCKVFIQATQSAHVKLAKCENFRALWPKQKNFFLAQEEQMTKLTKMAQQDPKLTPQLKAIQQSWLQRMTTFFSQK